jgi:EamA domain-containing membrane protein RarD
MKAPITLVCAVLTINSVAFGATVMQSKKETLTTTSILTKACGLITKSENEERIEYITIIGDCCFAYYTIDKKGKHVKSELELVLDKKYLIPLYPRLYEYLRTNFEAHVQGQAVVAQTSHSTSAQSSESASAIATTQSHS